MQQSLSTRHPFNVSRGFRPFFELTAVNLIEDIPPILSEILEWSLKTTESPPEDGSIGDGQHSTLSPDENRTTSINTDKEKVNILPQSAKEDKQEGPPSEDTDQQSVASRSFIRQLAVGLFGNLATSAAASKSQTQLELHLVPKLDTKQPPKTITAECISCFEDLPLKKVNTLACTHTYCQACLRSLVMTAIQNESAFPAKCCLSEIPLQNILLALDSKERQLYKEKASEYSIPANNRWYCPNTQCLKWIPPHKLHRKRKEVQKCPHCSFKICSTCRGPSHEGTADCPEDFGLATTLDIAESEGWQRCYSCRTMVELTTGCRHIRCKCGSEFCYVCAKIWPTCDCTETDKINRQAQLRQRRTEQDKAALAEAEEIAEAIAAVEEMERANAEARAREEQRLEAERFKEEAELARFEQERLAEEAAREQARLEAEVQLKEALRISITEASSSLQQVSEDLFAAQKALLDHRHESDMSQLMTEFEAAQSLHQQIAIATLESMHNNIQRRVIMLQQRHQSAFNTLCLQLEEREDDIFLQVQLRLRGKTNREAREQKMQEDLRKELEEEKASLVGAQMFEHESLEKVTKMEMDGVHYSIEANSRSLRKEQKRKLKQSHEQITDEKHWFELVTERRRKMVEQHNKLMLAEFLSDEEPVGLTEELAANVKPFLLPPTKTYTAETAVIDPDMPTTGSINISELSASGELVGSNTRPHGPDMIPPPMRPPPPPPPPPPQRFYANPCLHLNNRNNDGALKWRTDSNKTYEASQVVPITSTTRKPLPPTRTPSRITSVGGTNPFAQKDTDYVAYKIVSSSRHSSSYVSPWDNMRSLPTPPSTPTPLAKLVTPELDQGQIGSNWEPASLPTEYEHTSSSSAVAHNASPKHLLALLSAPNPSEQSQQKASNPHDLIETVEPQSIASTSLNTAPGAFPLTPTRSTSRSGSLGSQETIRSQPSRVSQHPDSTRPKSRKPSTPFSFSRPYSSALPSQSSPPDQFTSLVQSFPMAIPHKLSHSINKWSFRRSSKVDKFSEEELKERMKKTAGDALFA